MPGFVIFGTDMHIMMDVRKYFRKINITELTKTLLNAKTETLCDVEDVFN